MHLLTTTILLLLSGTLSLAAPPFWGIFEQTPLLNSLLTTPASSSSSIKKTLRKASIIPDVLPKNFTPSISLSITFPKSHTTLHLGSTLPPSNVSSAPVFHLSPLTSNLSPTPTSKKNTTYTLVLTDPDATSHADPVKAEMCHWIVTGIQLSSSSSFSFSRSSCASSHAVNPKEEEEEEEEEESDNHTPNDNDNDDGESSEKESNPNEIIPYFPPTPPPKTGFHRYVFVVLASEDEGEKKGEVKKPKERPHWGFGEQGRGVMDWAAENGLRPVGASFFWSQHAEQ